MLSRLYAPCYARSVWIANQDILPQLLNLKFTDNSPVFLAQGPQVGQIANAPHGTLWGRPIVFTEVARTLGAEGDLALVDMSQYMTVRRTQGVKASTSVHLHFDQDLMTFKFILRIAGQPLWRSQITPAQGSATKSCFVTLAARSS